ncbi:MAG: TrmH family RNA methyltransferase [Myxococcota bacterium]
MKVQREQHEQAGRAGGTRRRLAGTGAVEGALDAGDPVRCVVLPELSRDARADALATRARQAGIDVLRVAPRRFERLRGADADAGVLAMVGPDPRADLPEVMGRGGAVWLLSGTVYPGNVGFAIRTAEVSGADGLYVDNAFDHAARREAVRASMRADRFMPVGWRTAAEVIDAAVAAGKRVVGIEDVGTAPPWGLDLTGPLLLVVGAEADGVPRAVLDRCDAVARLPMSGFIASYNLQAAVAAVACERFRQLESRA